MAANHLDTFNHPFFLRMAAKRAADSLDPSTQVGAVLMTSQHILAACNAFPDGIARTPERDVAPLKYNYTIHAEANVLATAARRGIPTEGAVLYCTWGACSRCATLMVACGVSAMVVLETDACKGLAHWAEELALGLAILAEAGVEVRREAAEMPENLRLRVGGVSVAL